MGKIALFRIGATVFLLFLISLIKSCDEARYLMFGKTVQTTIYTVREGGRSDNYPQVLYQFKDGERLRKESDDLKPEDPHTGPITIQYIPGSSDSRLNGHTEWWWTAIPGALLIPVGIFFFKFWKFYKS